MIANSFEGQIKFLLCCVAHHRKKENRSSVDALEKVRHIGFHLRVCSLLQDPWSMSVLSQSMTFIKSVSYNKFHDEGLHG